MSITVVGAGLAGSEAAHRISRFGIKVKLLEMKPEVKTPAHVSDSFAELVCSNSLKSTRLQAASGLLKEEMKILGSLSMEAAYKHAVPAGDALAVDRNLFSAYITDSLKANPLIEVIGQEVKSIPEDRPLILATGPLTSGPLMEGIAELVGDRGHFFFDAVAPLFHTESLDQTRLFRQSRFGKGGDDYLNCPLTEDEYYNFVDQLVKAQTAPMRDFESKKLFEACMPLEEMSARGKDTLRFGPLKPIGLTDPKTGKMPFACVQLRVENKEASLYSPVGFQTRLTFSEQRRIFGMLPGLENADFARYGVMHRNSYIKSPGVLDSTYMMAEQEGIYFAGQISGVEGYVESMASGLIAGTYAALRYRGVKNFPVLSDKTMIGALPKHISNYKGKNFTPMNANFGLIAALTENDRNFREFRAGHKGKIKKSERYELYSERALEEVKAFAEQLKFYLV